MALHSKKKFAEICSITTSNVAQYIKRGRIGVGKIRINIVVIDGQELIDDQDPVNEIFLKRRQESSKYKNKAKQLKSPTKKESLPITPENDKKKVKTLKEDLRQEVEANGNSKKSDMFHLELEQKQINLEKDRISLRMQTIKEQKLIGELIPVALVKPVITQLSQSFVTSYKASVEDVLTILAKQKSMNVNEIAEIRGKLVEIINTSSSKSVQLASKSIDRMIEEYSLSKGVGEHD